MPTLYERFGVASPFDERRAWVSSPWFSPIALAVLRLTIAVYTTTTLIVVLANDIHGGAGEAYLSYFTRLSYIGLCAYFWAAGVQTAIHALYPHSKTYPLQRWPRFLQFLHVLLFGTITTFPIIVTVVYWVLLASPASFRDLFTAWNNISVHALNSVFAIMEMLLTNAGPAPWLHTPLVVLLIACYLGVAYITYATQGFYTYSFLDPQKQGGKVAAYIAGIGLAAALFFAIAWGICTLRNKLMRGRGLREVDEMDVPRESLSQWEEVDLEKDIGAMPRKRLE